MVTPGAGRTSGYASAGMAVGLLVMMGGIVAVGATVGAVAGWFTLGGLGALGGGVMGGAAGVYFVYTIA